MKRRTSSPKAREPAGREREKWNSRLGNRQKRPASVAGGCAVLSLPTACLPLIPRHAFSHLQPSLLTVRTYSFALCRRVSCGRRAFVNVRPAESGGVAAGGQAAAPFQYDQIVTIPVTVPSPRRGMLYSGTTDKTDQSVLEVAIWKSCEWKTCPR